MNAIHAGEIKALLSICFNPAGLAAGRRLHARSAGEAGVLRRDRFLPVGNRAARRCRPRRQPAGGRRGRHLQRGRRASSTFSKAVDPPGNARRDSRSSATWRAASARANFSRFSSTREIFDELRVASRGGIADYYGITYEKIDAQMGVFWPCPDARSSRHAAACSKAASHSIRTANAAFSVTEWRESGDPVDEEFPIYLTTGRVVSQYLSGTQTRRIGALVDMYPEPRWRSIRAWPSSHGIADEDWVTVTTRRDEITLQAMVVRTIRPDTVFIPYHWAGSKSANR